jgi:hypothetical protein
VAACPRLAFNVCFVSSFRSLYVQSLVPEVPNRRGAPLSIADHSMDSRNKLTHLSAVIATKANKTQWRVALPRGLKTCRFISSQLYERGRWVLSWQEGRDKTVIFVQHNSHVRLGQSQLRRGQLGFSVTPTCRPVGVRFLSVLVRSSS